MGENCKICGGSGELPVKMKNKYTGKYYLGYDKCLCTRSSLVSGEYDLLRCMGKDYLEFDEINPALQFDPETWEPSNKNTIALEISPNGIPNYIIEGEHMTFCANMKSFIMKHRFAENAMKIFCESSIKVVHNFHVQQNDGSSPHLSALNNYALVILIFDNEEKNNALKACISQVVAMRLWHKKPTWIYLKKPLNVCTEYDGTLLDEYLKKFVSINILSNWEGKVTQKITKSQQNAANGWR